jgi:magnesium transporter
MDTDLILFEKFINVNPRQAAQTIEGLEDEEASDFLEGIPVELSTKLISLMNVYKVGKYLRLIKTDIATSLLEKSDIQKTEQWLRQVDEGFRSKLLDGVSTKLAEVLRPKLEYPAHSVGALMTPLNFILREDMVVKDVIRAIKGGNDWSSTDACVVQEDGTLMGIIRFQDLLLANDKDIISSIMKTQIPKFFADLPADSIKKHPGWFDYKSIPVVDRSNRLMGTINFDAIQLNKIDTGMERTKQVMETSSALSELYRIGLAAILESVSK